MDRLKVRSTHVCFDGMVSFYSHASSQTKTEMNFSIFFTTLSSVIPLISAFVTFIVEWKLYLLLYFKNKTFCSSVSRFTIKEQKKFSILYSVQKMEKKTLKLFLEIPLKKPKKTQSRIMKFQNEVNTKRFGCYYYDNGHVRQNFWF